MSEKYKFSIDFQRQLLKLLFVDETFIARFWKLIKSEYFEERNAQVVVFLLFKYYKKYETVPSLTVVKEELKQLIESKKSNLFNVSQEELEDLYSYIEEVIKQPIELRDLKYIEDQVIRFAKNQALKKFILSSTELVLKEQYDTLWTNLQTALSVGEDVKDIGVDLLSEEEIEKRIKEREGGIRKDAIALGIQKLDEQLYGGVCPGELCVVLAPSGAGKSIILVSFGKSFVKQGKTVFHYTLELSERVITNRYDASFTSVKYHELNKYPEKVRNRLLKVASRYGKVLVKWFPGGETSIMDIENHIRVTKALKGIEPDVVIIDYGDEMISTSNRYKEQHWLEQGQVFKELSNFAIKYNVPVITATQTKISAIGKDRITAKDIGESYNKVKKSDIILAFSQTEEEEMNGKGKIYTAKVRDSVGHRTIYVEIDKERMKIEWDEEAQEMYE